MRTLTDVLRPRPLPGGEDVFGAREPIGVICGHHSGAVAALMAVLASGFPVLFMDPTTPPPRLRKLGARVGVRVIVCDEENEGLARRLAQDVIVVGRDGVLPTGPLVPLETLWAHPPVAAEVAAVAFTSGSTGQPKPVANDHRLLIRDAWNSSVATQCYSADDSIAHTLPIAFHAGLTTTVHVLVVGATMHLYDARNRGIGALPAFIHDHECSMMISSPGILRAFCVSRPDRELLRTLRTLTIAGEAAYAADVEAARSVLPSTCIVRNRYGSSETGLIAERIVTPEDVTRGGPLPIGQGVGRTTIELRNDKDQPVAVGESGRLHVSAPSVALGYWGMPAETEAAFYDNPDGSRTYRTSDLGRRLEDGSIQLVGRADHSVKVRGYLVDPGEVDAVLFDMPTVREAVVVGGTRPDDHRTQLIGYVVPNGSVTEHDIRAAVRGQLPAHMVPDQIIFLDRLPRNDRGKIDRFALPKPTPGPLTPAEVPTHWEELVGVHWAAVLDVATIHPSDDFFALGGDSLAAEAVMVRMVEDLGISPRIAKTGLLAEAPQLREFARRLKAGGRPTSGGLVTLQPHGSKTPLWSVAGGGGLAIAFFPLARRLGPEQPCYALQSPLLEGRGLPERSVAQIARRHVAVMRATQPNGPYRIAGHSFGGLLALEMAQQLKAAGEHVDRLIILDSFPPDPRLHAPLPRLGLRRRLKAKAGLLRAALRDTSGGAEAWRFYDQAGLLGMQYHGREWSGPTLVTVADSPERDRRAQWGGFLTGDWAAIDVPGDHISMLRSPAVDELARQVELFLTDPAWVGTAGAGLDGAHAPAGGGNADA